ncbi:MAG: hypothetical protein M1816_001821 [Peltula sp. TS41687]|nr:MAG: hypothetical protein M1816_001821 [Peltula sp. TS41687]
METVRKLVQIQGQNQHSGVSQWEMISSLPVAGFKVISKLENQNKRLFLQSITPLLGRDLAPHDRTVARSIIKNWMISLQADEHLSLLQEITQGVHEAEPALLCLRIAISTIEEQSSRTKEALAQVYRSLCETLKKSDGIRQFRLVMDCLGSIILTRPWALSQWEIDTTLACIVFIASSHGPELPTRYAGYIYSRLCGLLSGLLTVHRLKLRGRFHIIIPVLQSLLRCLFTPNQAARSSQSKSNNNTVPSWLPPAKGLEAPQATAYARLLTSLCDPTVSSVTTGGKKRPKDELTSATDKARTMAGQHLPYVLMEYIQCRLRSNLASAEVKHALMPGLYAILDSMTRESRRMLNAAMDSSGRAMWRNLWADYTRFTRWNES